MTPWRGRMLLVGESNPYGSDPRMALYPNPERSAGFRLCTSVLGMRRAAYLRAFERVNLLAGSAWSIPAAREAARVLSEGMGPADCAVLLGRRVYEAWSRSWSLLVLTSGKREWVPFSRIGNVLALPHPSGRCRLWNEPGAIDRARTMVLELAPWLSGELGVASGRGGD